MTLRRRRWLRVARAGCVAIAALGLVVTLVVLASAWQWRRAPARTLAAHLPPGALVDVGGRRLHIVCAGSGAPAVVFEASGFGNHTIFGRAFDETARHARACAYDRAGMGYSDASPEPLDARHLAADLDKLLRAAGVAPPVVLVGMSIGGPIVRLYAHDHPRDVAGMVLIDPMPEDFIDLMPRSRAAAQRLLRVAPWLARAGLLRWIDPFGLARLPREQARLAMALNYRAGPWLAARDLVEQLPSSIDEVREAPLPRGLPLVVIAHGVPGDVLGPVTDLAEARAQEARWQGAQQALAASVDGGWFERAEGAGHIVPETRPDLVVGAIERVRALSRR
jgi:pimeloyl-ACP methyl ester carboxylesterase